MNEVYSDPLVRLLLGDCVIVMAELEAESVDSVVCDPPYNLSFMGREWDKNLNHGPWATEAFRVLKPGGYLLAFGGTRTYHRLASAIEDAGFEIRDTLMWIYASGFPKSLDVSKALDKAAEVNVETNRRIEVVGQLIAEHRTAKGMTPQEVSVAIVGTPSGACWNWEHIQLPSVEHWPKIKAVLAIPDRYDDLLYGDRSKFIAAEREVVGERRDVATRMYDNGEGPRMPDVIDVTAPATDLARKWEGWGTALKPAHEPIVMARKPLVGTVAANVTRYGTGALNIDGSRIGTSKDVPASLPTNAGVGERGWGFGPKPAEADGMNPNIGRWPSNVLLSDPELFDEPNPWVVGSGATSESGRGSTNGAVKEGSLYQYGLKGNGEPIGYGDSGGYSRFFLVPKAPKQERMVNGQRGTHPTQKPVDLMRHLLKLVTPPGGVALDPFAGSGTTGVAASLEGIRSILIEREAEYADQAVGRLMATPMGLGLFGTEDDAA